MLDLVIFKAPTIVHANHSEG